MARSVSRKFTKKCGPRKHGRKAHMRGGKMIKATCVKNRRRMTKSRNIRQRAMYDDMDPMANNTDARMMERTGYGGMRAMRPKSKSRKSSSKSKSRKSSSKSKSRKSSSKSKSRKSSSKSKSRKSSSKSKSRRVIGTGACTSRKISECTKDARCQIRRRPKGGRTCVLGKGWKQVHDEAERMAMIGAY